MNQPMKNSMDKERIIMKKKYPHILSLLPSNALLSRIELL